MSEVLSETVTTLRRSAGYLGDAGAAVMGFDPGAQAFGAGGPGRLGELGRELYVLWQRTLDARMREAVTQGTRLDELADAVARAAAGYTDVDQHPREAP